MVLVVGYAHVFTTELGDSGLGLASQEATIQATCRTRGLELLRIHQEIASSGGLDGP